MTNEREFDTLLRSWFEESAPSGQPQGLLEAVLTASGHTRPRPAWLVGLGGDPMARTGRRGLNRFAPLALAGAAVVVALLIAIGLVVQSPNVGPPPVPGPSNNATPDSAADAAGWTVTADMIDARSGHTATLLPDGMVLVVGGSGPNGALASAELYDPASGSWTTTGSLIAARFWHTATLLRDGKVLVTGGGARLDVWYSAELYDPVSGTWTSTANMSDSRWGGHTATLLRDGKVLVTGGGSASSELYDPVSGTWTTTGDMVEQRSYHAATLLPDGTVLVAGGGGPENSLATAERYNPDTGTWTATGPMGEGRSYIDAWLLPDGTVLVAGGWAFSNGEVTELASAERYDPASGTWTATGSLNRTHGRLPTGSVLRDGTVLLAGGCCAGVEYLASAERYDPISGTWIATADLFQGRAGHTATLLLDGTVLVVGGYVGQDPEILLSSTERYDPGSGL